MSILYLRESKPLAERRPAVRYDSIRALPDIGANSDSSKIEPGYRTSSANGKPALERKLITMQPSAEDDASIELTLGRNAIVAPDVEKPPAVRAVLRYQSLTESWNTEITCSVLVVRLDEPSGPRIDLAGSRVEIERHAGDVDPPVVDERVDAPVIVATK